LVTTVPRRESILFVRRDVWAFRYPEQIRINETVIMLLIVFSGAGDMFLILDALVYYPLQYTEKNEENLTS